MLLRIVVYFALLFLTAGCVVTYSIKPSAEKAMVRFITNVTDSTSFTHLNLQTCPEPQRSRLALMGWVVPNETSTLKMLGTSGASESKIAERETEAGQPFHAVAESAVYAGQYNSGYSCVVGFVFEPTPGRQYEVNYVYEGSRCGVRVFELVKSNDGGFIRQPEPTLRTFRARTSQEICLRKP